MEKKLILVAIFLIFTLHSIGQGLLSFTNDLLMYKNQFYSLVQTETEVDNLEYGLDNIHRSVDNLQTEIESYMKNNGLYTSTDYKTLLAEVEDYSSFTSSRSSCKCLYNMDKFLSEMRTSLVIVKETKEVRIVEAELGNFKFYYAYGLNFRNYSVVIKYNLFDRQTGMPTGGSTLKYKLYGSIRIVEKINSSTILKIKSLSVDAISSPTGFDFLKCSKDFPRI